MVCQVPSPVQILFIDRLLKGDKGDPGTSGSGGESVQEHEAMYDHGELHEHANKGLLDLLSVDGNLLEYNGISVVAMVLLDSEFTSWQAEVETVAGGVVLCASNEWNFRNNYSFVAWLSAYRTAEYDQMIAAGWTPAVYIDNSPG